ncbi:unnamed protein product [Mytilus coruscus]|uniref:HTH psq-type domain-containing protein n=1 Tax=Mytilus coruscus TaxID=42192 RepID=A0A6J8AWT7_MYTCO|nr:unnamed protein product [Mytilus coruscus]
MTLAFDAVVSGKMNARKAAIEFGVPQTTLYDKIYREQKRLMTKCVNKIEQWNRGKMFRTRQSKNAGRKGKDYKWYTPSDLEKAVEAFRSGKMNGRQAAEYYGVPVGTVYDRVAKTKPSLGINAHISIINIYSVENSSQIFSSAFCNIPDSGRTPEAARMYKQYDEMSLLQAVEAVVTGHFLQKSRDNKNKLQYRKKYSEETLLRALDSVITGEMSQTGAAKYYGVPQQTIFSRLKKMRSYTEPLLFKRSKRKVPPRYREYDEESLRQAIQAVYSGKMTQTQASKAFGVPRQTIGKDKTELEVAAVLKKIQAQPHSCGGLRGSRRRKDYKDYHQANLEMAVTAVMSGEMNAIQASHCYGVPSRTIYDRVAKARNSGKKKQNENKTCIEIIKPEDFKTDPDCSIISDNKEQHDYVVPEKVKPEEYKTDTNCTVISDYKEQYDYIVVNRLEDDDQEMKFCDK